MVGFRAIALPVLLLFSVVACGPATDRSEPARDSAGAAAPDEHSAAGHSPAAEGGEALLPIMQRLGGEMNALTYALMTDDAETVARSAAAIAAHAPVSAAELDRVRTVLQADMARFEAVDESVHIAAARLREAAQSRKPDLVVQRLGEVQRGCVSCHAQFREQLRTNGGPTAAPGRPASR